MHSALADVAAYFDDIVRAHAPSEAAGAIDIGMRHGPARIGLERERLGHPARAETIGQHRVVAGARVREGMKEAVHAFEHGARTQKSGATKKRSAQARLRRPAGMKPFGPGAFGEIYDDARGHRAGIAERIDELAQSQPQR